MRRSRKVTRIWAGMARRCAGSVSFFFFFFCAGTTAASLDILFRKRAAIMVARPKLGLTETRQLVITMANICLLPIFLTLSGFNSMEMLLTSDVTSSTAHHLCLLTGVTVHAYNVELAGFKDALIFCRVSPKP